MKFKINANEAAVALKMATAVIGSRTPSAVLAGVLLEEKEGQIQATASNGECTIKVLLHAEEVAEGGTALLDGRKLYQAFASLPNKTASLETSGDKSATLKCGGTRFTIAQISGKFPEKSPIDGGVVSARAAAFDIAGMINKVKYAVATTDVRMMLTGEKWEIRPDRINAVALDGYRMGVTKIAAECGAEKDIIVPMQACGMIADACRIAGEQDAEIQTNGRALQFSCGDVSIQTVLLSGEYIEYRKLIPTNYATSVRFNRMELLGALKRAGIVAAKANLVRIQALDGEIVAESNSDVDAFSEHIPCQKSGEDMSTAYNIRYLTDTLNAVDGDEVQLDLETATKPGVLKPADGGKELHIVLPVRIVAE